MDNEEESLRKMMNRLAAGIAIEKAMKKAQPYINKGVAQAKEKLVETAANVMDRVPLEQVMKTVASAKAAAEEGKRLREDLQSSLQGPLLKIVGEVQDYAEKQASNPVIAEFRRDAEELLKALRSEAPAAEEAAPEAPAADETPAAEEAPKAKKPRNRKPRGPKLG